MTIVCIYAPKEGKKDENLEFYETFQLYINTINRSDFFSCMLSI